MNLFFGLVGGAEHGTRFAGACERIGAVYQMDPRPASQAAPAFAATCSDGGAVLGHAEADEASLSYVGAILRGVPDWPHGASPLDDPDLTAEHLLTLYRRKGLAFLDGVPGSYAVVVTDRKTGRVLLAVDPANGHSLFVRREGDGLAYASKLGAFPLLCPDLTLDRGLEDFLLGYQFLPDGRTVYRGVRALPKGTMLEWRDGAVAEHAIAPSAGEDVPDLSGATQDEVAGALHDRFMQAVSDVAPTSERVAVLLGGFDSALVAAALRRLGREVDTYSFAFEDEAYNQPHTGTLETFAGTRHHWVRVTPDVIAEGLDSYERVFNQTAVQPHYPIESAHVCRVIRRDGLSHALTGDGCDGLFLGYPTIYRRTRIIGALSRLPRALRAAAESATRSPRLERRLGHPYRMFRNVLAMLARDPVVRDHLASRALDGFSLSLLRDEAPPQDREVEDILRDLAAQVADLNPVRRAYHSKALAGGNKNKMEGSMDATGVALTSPYTHPGFARLAAGLPDELSRPRDGKGGQGKFVLMRMAETSGLVPREIAEQPKRSPAEAPVDAWYSTVLRDRALSMLDELPFRVDRTYAEALLKPKLAERLYRRHVSLDDVASHALTALMTYAAFSRAVGARDS